MSDLLNEDHIIDPKEANNWWDGFEPSTEVKADVGEETVDAGIGEENGGGAVAVSDQASWLKEMNTHLGTSYESADALKSILDKSINQDEKVVLNGAGDSQIEEYKAKLQKVVDLYKSKQDPSSFFANDIEFKKNLLLKSNPNINGEVAGDLFSIDFNKANPIDLIAMDMLVKHTRIEGGREAAKELVLDKFGLDSDFNWDDLSVKEKNAINIASEDAIHSLSALRDSVKSPELEDIDLLLEGITFKQEPEFDTTPWKSDLNEIVSNLKMFEIKEGDELLYSEAIDDEFVKGSESIVMETIRQGKLENTPKNKALLADMLIREYVAEDYDKIIKRVLKAQELKLKEEFHRKAHNDTDPDKVIQRPKTSKVMSNEQIRRVLGLNS